MSKLSDNTTYCRLLITQEVNFMNTQLSYALQSHETKRKKIGK